MVVLAASAVAITSLGSSAVNAGLSLGAKTGVGTPAIGAVVKAAGASAAGIVNIFIKDKKLSITLPGGAIQGASAVAAKGAVGAAGAATAAAKGSFEEPGS